jgi:hypothetical protein
LFSVLAANPKEIRIIPIRPIGPEDIPNIRSAYRNLQTMRASARVEIATWHVPASARKLHESFEQLFEFEEASMPKLGELIKLIENEKLSARQKSDRGSQILKDIEAAEQPHLSELQKVQREFAAAHGMRVMPDTRMRF